MLDISYTKHQPAQATAPTVGAAHEPHTHTEAGPPVVVVDLAALFGPRGVATSTPADNSALSQAGGHGPRRAPARSHRRRRRAAPSPVARRRQAQATTPAARTSRSATSSSSPAFRADVPPPRPRLPASWDPHVALGMELVVRMRSAARRPRRRGQMPWHAANLILLECEGQASRSAFHRGRCSQRSERASRDADRGRLFTRKQWREALLLLRLLRGLLRLLRGLLCLLSSHGLLTFLRLGGSFLLPIGSL